jgi:hypothetical protein
MSRMTFTERIEKFEAALAAAVSSSDADQALADMSAGVAVNSYEQITLVVTLGDTRGPAGSAAVRAAFNAALDKYDTARKTTGSAYRDLLCACVITLAKREGPAATDVYATAATYDNPGIREYGASALAAVGDDRAWDEILTWLDAALERKVRPTTSYSRQWAGVCGAIEYLTRHSVTGSARAARLVTLLRDRWPNMADPELVEGWWPGIEPGGPAPELVNLPGSHVPSSWWEPRP